MPKTTDTIAGLRFQHYPESKEVHVHDDARGLKFVASLKEFKQDLSEAIKELKSTTGSTLISGTSTEQLYMISDGSKIKACVLDGKLDLTKELESFLKKL
jgi:hypothetical protein